MGFAPVPDGTDALACGSFAELTDHFDLPTTDPKWLVDQEPGASIDQSSGEVVIMLAGGAIPALAGYESICHYDGRDHRAQIFAARVPNVAPATEMFLDLRADPSHRVGLVFAGGSLIAHHRVGGEFVGLTSVMYDSTVHRFWQLSEQSGTMVWNTSPDGLAWTQLWSEPDPFDMSAVAVVFGADFYETTTDPGRGTFDDLVTE